MSDNLDKDFISEINVDVNISIDKNINLDYLPKKYIRGRIRYGYKPKSIRSKIKCSNCKKYEGIYKMETLNGKIEYLCVRCYDNKKIL